jgi:hypothetical protein
VKVIIHLHLVPRSKNTWSYTSTPPIPNTPKVQGQLYLYLICFLVAVCHIYLVHIYAFQPKLSITVTNISFQNMENIDTRNNTGSVYSSGGHVFFKCVIRDFTNSSGFGVPLLSIRSAVVGKSVDHLSFPLYVVKYTAYNLCMLVRSVLYIM